MKKAFSHIVEIITCILIGSSIEVGLEPIHRIGIVFGVLILTMIHCKID